MGDVNANILISYFSDTILYILYDTFMHVNALSI